MKSGEIVGDPNDYGNELSLLNVSKNAAGTYICRAQLFSLMDEKTTEIKVHCKCNVGIFQNIHVLKQFRSSSTYIQRESNVLVIGGARWTIGVWVLNWENRS